MKLLRFLPEGIAWLQIAAAPLLAGIFLAGLAYSFFRSKTGVIAAAAILFAGLITGILWATKVARKEGAVHFMSRVSATPELYKEK